MYGGGGGGARGGGGRAIADDWGSGGKGKEAKGGKGKGKEAKGGKPNAPVIYSNNAKGKKLCMGFQNGSCKSRWLPKEKKYEPLCPTNKDDRHQCNLCLGTDHGAGQCPNKLSKKQRRKGKGDW